MESTHEEITEATRWQKLGWIAQVMKNEDDDGWAVAMTRVGDSEPALVGPWTMGRDKRNPKPLDASAFATLVKTATEVLRRHEEAVRARMHKTLTFSSDAGDRLRADLDLAMDDDDPHAILSVTDAASGESVRRGRVRPDFKLNASSVARFVRTGEG